MESQLADEEEEIDGVYFYSARDEVDRSEYRICSATQITVDDIYGNRAMSGNEPRLMIEMEVDGHQEELAEYCGLCTGDRDEDYWEDVNVYWQTFMEGHHVEWDPTIRF